MLIKISAILWRRCNKATFDTLNDLSRGQYHIGLSRRSIDEFFFNVPRTELTARGGYTLLVPIERYEGKDPVESTQLAITYIGDDSERGDWRIRSQRSGTAYELWRPGRGVPRVFNSQGRDFLIIARDVEGKYHARWIRENTFDSLPSVVQDMLISREMGWESLI